MSHNKGNGRSRTLALEQVRENDPDGRIVLHHRAVDPLGRMLKSGSIDQAMHDAGRVLQRDFVLAQLDPLRAADLMRVPGSGREPEAGETQLAARRRVHRALLALGGHNSPAGSCGWHVLGCGRSVREWALRQGWSGRAVPVHQAHGILLAALGLLAGHYGLAARSGPRSALLDGVAHNM